MQVESLPSPALAPVVVAAAPNRVLSIDILRGITIAFMILVNDPGDGHHTYAQLEHATWNGFTLTDLVFPTFLFLVGASIILSLSTRIARGDSPRSLALNMLRRAATIFLIDLFLAAFPLFHLTTLRIYGVLTRIAVCYLVVGLLCLVTRRIATLLSIAAVLLVGYWAIMRFIPVPGFGIPTHDIPFLDPNRNLAAWLDRGFNDVLQRTIHTGRLYERTRDPEGILSTIPAFATAILGAVTALWLRRASPSAPAHLSASAINATPASPLQDSGHASPQTQHQTLRGLLLASVVCMAAGRLWNLTFPINKNLWTSSFVLFTAGCSLLGLSLSYWLVDILRFQHRSRVARAVLWPWLVFGSNAITVYAVAALLSRILSVIHVHDSWNPDPASLTTLRSWIYIHLFARGNSTDNTSLAFALAFVAVCFLPNLLLWRKRIFLKV